MNFADLIFLLIMFVTMIGALITVLSGSIIYAMLGLVMTMFGIAGLYLYLSAPFLAMMQILIYVGAIAILIAFAIMLVGPIHRGFKKELPVVKLGASLVVALFSFLIIYKVMIKAVWIKGTVNQFAMTTKDIGRLFFDRLAFPFELISLLIVVGIIGAIMLTLLSRSEK